MKISVCICTYKRPNQISKLVAFFLSEELSNPGDELELIVVDNDPNRSGVTALQGLADSFTVGFILVHVAIPNISAARNAAIERATGDYLAFIDDDEVPEANWLSNLYSALIDHNADIVFGPVVPEYNEYTPKWIIDGAYFDRARFVTGSEITVSESRSGNFMIKRDCFGGDTNPFSIAYGRTGGEDTLFFKKMKFQGKRMIWCDEAIVREEVPLSRSNASWLLRRSFRIGQTWVRTELENTRYSRYLIGWFRIFFFSVGQLAISLVLSFLLLPFSSVLSFKWLRTAVAQIGKVSALSGGRFNEYGH